jgi:ATP/maltotriose-dependent transcriptional regulator MalT/DNA-binding SARP family transcriptional activator
MRRFQQKLIVPAASRPLIDRSQLAERLEESISGRRVVALAAPAGWGKTTALSQWSTRTALPIAWYTLDSGDSDPSVFLDYLLHSIADYIPEIDDLITRLSTAPANELPHLYQAAALGVAAAAAPFALVLDDFHALGDDASATGPALINGFLASIAEYAPNCHLVVASRTPPALYGMVRLIAQQRAAVFDYTALQFSPGDVQRLAGITAGMMLSDMSAQHLTNQLGGWVTGIVLSLDQVRAQRTSDDSFSEQLESRAADQPLVEADTGRVYAFLAEQVIAPLPLTLQLFLEDTSVLTDLSPRRCDTLRGTTDSGMMLDEVRQYGLFVTSRAGWLSYHSLFREFLRTRLARDPRREERMLRMAAEIYAAEDEIEAALECYLSVGALTEAIALLRESVARYRRFSRQTTLLSCFDRLAAALSEQAGRGGRQEHTQVMPADLLIEQARVYSDLALWERAYLSIQLAETLGTQEQRWEAQIVHAELFRIQGHHINAQNQLETVPFDQLPNALKMIYCLRRGQICAMAGRSQEAIDALEQAYRLTQRSLEADNPNVLADIHDNLGWAYYVQGQLTLALRHMQRADTCWQTTGNSGRRAMTLNNIGVILTEEGKVGEARETFELGLDIARKTGRVREEASLQCSIAELDLTEGNFVRSYQQFAHAYASSEKASLYDVIEDTAVGAAWCASLAALHEDYERWRSVAESVLTPDRPATTGRLLLCELHQVIHEGTIDRLQATALLDQLSAIDEHLGLIERAYVCLAQTILANPGEEMLRSWQRFEEHAKRLHTNLLLHLLKPHHATLAQAARISPFAAQLLRVVDQPKRVRWHIQVLGGFFCWIDSRPADLSVLHRALLTRLLDAGPPGVAVERLWESVWGDTDLSMTALHQAMRRLRVQTGLSTAVRDGTCAIWGDWEQIVYDVRDLERTLDEPLSQQMIDRAIKLYRGEFLPGALAGTSLWVESRRTQLQERFLNTLELYASSIEAEQPQLALQYYQRALQIDGCREQTAVALMRLAARFGNRSLVNSTFEHLTGSLRILGASPAATTTALYRQLH